MVIMSKDTSVCINTQDILALTYDTYEECVLAYTNDGEHFFKLALHVETKDEAQEIMWFIVMHMCDGDDRYIIPDAKGRKAERQVNING